MDPEHVVLLVQPHGDSREMYAEFLRRNGFSILAVDNGHDALSAAVDAHIIVTGILVPGLDGLELIARLRSDTRTKNKAIIVLTACAFPADRARAEHAGCDVFLPMPCAPDELLRHVRRLLPRRFQGTPGESGAVSTSH
jgi:CheY-like chemotaxis protein